MVETSNASGSHVSYFQAVGRFSHRGKSSAERVVTTIRLFQGLLSHPLSKLAVTPVTFLKLGQVLLTHRVE